MINIIKEKKNEYIQKDRRDRWDFIHNRDGFRYHDCCFYSSDQGSSIVEVVFYKVPMAYYAINIVLDSIIFTWYSVIPVYVYLKEFGVESQLQRIGK